MTEKTKKIAKKRISAYAKSYNIDADFIVNCLGNIGVVVKKTASINEEDFNKIKFSVEKQQLRTERSKKAESGEKIKLRAVIKRASRVEKIIDTSKKEKSITNEIEVDDALKKDKKVGMPSIENSFESKPPVNVVGNISLEKGEKIVKAVDIEKSPLPTPTQETHKEDTHKKEPIVLETKEEIPKKEAPKEDDKEVTQNTFKKSPLKVTVDKTEDLAMLARIKKSQEQQQAKRKSGYSGRLGSVSNNRTDTDKEGNKPRDIYALRAQQAGISTESNFNKVSRKPTNNKVGGGATSSGKKGKRTGYKSDSKDDSSNKFSLRSSINKVMATLTQTPRKPVHKKEKKMKKSMKREK